MIAVPNAPPVVPSLIVVVELRQERYTSPTRTELNEGRILLNARLTAIRAQDRQLRRVPMTGILALPAPNSGVWVTHAGELRATHKGRVVQIADSCYVRQLRRGKTSFLFAEDACCRWDAGPRTERFRTEALTAEVINDNGRVRFLVCGKRRQRWDVTAASVSGTMFTVFFHALSQSFELHVKRGEVSIGLPRQDTVLSVSKGQCLLVDVASGATKLTDDTARPHAVELEEGEFDVETDFPAGVEVPLMDQ